MTSAETLITYIGVPLAVAGVLPLIFVFVKSILIWIRLSQSVPWELRPFFTLIPEPVSGTVIVAIKRLQLTDLGLWKQKPNPLKGRPRHKKIHVILYQIYRFTRRVMRYMRGHFRRRKAKPIRSRASMESDDISLEAQESSDSDSSGDEMPTAAVTSHARNGTQAGFIRFRSPKNLYRPWMSVALAMDLDLKEIEPSSEDYTTSVRYSVNIDFSTFVPPLNMTWAQFVFLMMGMDVEPQFLLDLEDGDRLETAHDDYDVRLKVSKTNNKWLISFDPRRGRDRGSFELRCALAAAHVMLVKGSDQKMLLVPAHRRKGAHDFNKFHSINDFDEVRLLMDISCSGEHWDRVDEAFTWALYYHKYGSDWPRPFRCTQGHNLKYIRQRSIRFLWKLSRQEIYDMLRSSCESNELVRNVRFRLDELMDEYYSDMCEHDALEGDLRRLRTSLGELTEFEAFDAFTEETILNWVAGEMDDPDVTCRHHSKNSDEDNNGGSEADDGEDSEDDSEDDSDTDSTSSLNSDRCKNCVNWSDNSVRRILSCLSAPYRYFESSGSRPSKRGREPLSSSMHDKDVQEAFYLAMKSHLSGSIWFANFEKIWKPIKSDECLISKSHNRSRAFMAHVFILLCFTEDSDRKRWNGTEFVEWEPPELKLFQRAQALFTTSEKWLIKIYGREPEDLAWFKNPTSKDNKPSHELKMADIAAMMERIKEIGWSEMRKWMHDVQFCLEDIELSLYQCPVIDMRELFNKHKTTVVELT